MELGACDGCFGVEVAARILEAEGFAHVQPVMCQLNPGRRKQEVSKGRRHTQQI